MEKTKTFIKLNEKDVNSLKKGIYTLPPVVYHDDEIFKLELERFFSKMWLCAAREEDLQKAGDYLVRNVGGLSFFLIRGKDGSIRAFHNFCRHRGAKLITEEKGNKRVIQCPYHAWTYSTEGSLLGAPDMEGVSWFKKEDYPLIPLKVEIWGGFVFVNTDEKAPPLQSVLEDFFKQHEHLPIAELKRGGKLVYDVKANWKIIAENYSECYHCPSVHPTLNRITPYDYETNEILVYFDWDSNRPYWRDYMCFAKDYNSMTLTGYTKRPPIRGTKESDRRKVFYSHIFPNMFFSLHPDYLMVHTLWPVNKDRTLIECDFYFDPPAMADPSFDPSDAIQVWDEINRQDWEVCELTHEGTSSIFAKPGVISKHEEIISSFNLFVAKGLGLI